MVDAIKDQAERGIHFGTLNEQCIQLAEDLKEVIPCADRVAFTTTNPRRQPTPALHGRQRDG